MWYFVWKSQAIRFVKKEGVEMNKLNLYTVYLVIFGALLNYGFLACRYVITIATEGRFPLPQDSGVFRDTLLLLIYLNLVGLSERIRKN